MLQLCKPTLNPVWTVFASFCWALPIQQLDLCSMDLNDGRDACSTRKGFFLQVSKFSQFVLLRVSKCRLVGHVTLIWLFWKGTLCWASFCFLGHCWGLLYPHLFAKTFGSLWFFHVCQTLEAGGMHDVHPHSLVHSPPIPKQNHYRNRNCASWAQHSIVKQSIAWYRKIVILGSLADCSPFLRSSVQPARIIRFAELLMHV